MPLRVLIAGGGTGGHVIPALAIARELRDRHGAEVRFLGTARGLETRLVPEAGFPLDLIRVGQLKSVSLSTRLRTLADLPLGLARCIALIRSFRPTVVIGVGGYASGPGMLAALLLRLPTLAFEPNAAPGLANRLIGKHVAAAAVNFPDTTCFFHNAHVTGIPVRPDFFAITPLPPTAPPRLLIFGGSQGARIFNQVLPTIAAELLAAVPGLTLLHQCGANHVVATSAAYAATAADAARYTVSAFLDDMPARFAEARLILCRSGASTVAELAAAGRASILVPFPGATDDHQRLNAEQFAQSGRALVHLQTTAEALAAQLLTSLTALLRDGPRCAEMGRQTRGAAHPNAASDIAALATSLTRSATPTQQSS